MLIYESSICYNFLNVFITTSKISSFVTMEGTLMSNKYDALLSHLQEEKNPTQCTLLKLYMLIRKKSSASFSFANRKNGSKISYQNKSYLLLHKTCSYEQVFWQNLPLAL